MERTSVQLSPEVSRKLQLEARKMGEETGQTVTVSDLIRACIGEKFPQVLARMRHGNAALTELQEEVARLSERFGILSRDLDNLVQVLTESVPQLSTKAQVEELADALVTVLRASRERS